MSPRVSVITTGYPSSSRDRTNATPLCPGETTKMRQEYPDHGTVMRSISSRVTCPTDAEVGIEPGAFKGHGGSQACLSVDIDRGSCVILLVYPG